MKLNSSREIGERENESRERKSVTSTFTFPLVFNFFLFFLFFLFSSPNKNDNVEIIYGILFLCVYKKISFECSSPTESITNYQYVNEFDKELKTDLIGKHLR